MIEDCIDCDAEQKSWKEDVLKFLYSAENKERGIDFADCMPIANSVLIKMLK